MELYWDLSLLFEINKKFDWPFTLFIIFCSLLVYNMENEKQFILLLQSILEQDVEAAEKAGEI